MIIYLFKLSVSAVYWSFHGRNDVCTRDLPSNTWGRRELGRQENSQKLMGFVSSTGYMRVHCLLLSFCVCVSEKLHNKIKS